MIEQLYIDELSYNILKNGVDVEKNNNDDDEYLVDVHKDCSIFSCENLHDQQKVETFLEWADKLNPQELEKRLSNETS